MKSSHFISHIPFHLPTGSPRWCQSASSWACSCESPFSFSDQGSQFLQDAHTIKVRPDTRTDADLICPHALQLLPVGSSLFLFFPTLHPSQLPVLWTPNSSLRQSAAL